MPDRVVATTKYLRLIDRDGWFFVDRPNAHGVTAIVAVTDDQRLVLVEQHRPALGGPAIELPAGLAGDDLEQAGEALEMAARRELLEETGYEARSVERVAAGAASAGMTNEVMTLFLASGLKKVGAAEGDGQEDITVHEVPLDGVVDWLAAREREGKLIDLKLYAGLYFACRTTA